MNEPIHSLFLILTHLKITTTEVKLLLVKLTQQKDKFKIDKR